MRREFTSPDFRDDDWEPVSVPGHWRSVAAFSDSHGPLLYRTVFSSPPGPPPPGSQEKGAKALGAPTATPGGADAIHFAREAGLTLAQEEGLTRWWLAFDGIFYQADVWLDGEYLGDTEGYFFTHEFEVTEQLEARSEHLLAVEVSCNPPRDLRRKQNITGVFEHWDMVPEGSNPGGIWAPVRLRATGPVAIRHFRAICTRATAEEATVACRAVLLSDTARKITITTEIAAQRKEATHTLASGENRVEWKVSVPRPRLWWPRELGDPHLEDLRVEVRLEDGRLSDARSRRIGLRSVKLHRWHLHVNGERLFVRGSNYAPTHYLLATATRSEIEEDLTRAEHAHLNLLRIHGHVARRELYELADTKGMLLWQDYPLQWGYSTRVFRQARRQAREMVDMLGHHPSIVVWCAHNEPFAVEVGSDPQDAPKARRRAAFRTAASTLLPAWNRSVLDRSVKRVLVRCDRSRPVVPHSGVLPHPPWSTGTDTHLYPGWYSGRARDLARWLRMWPRLGAFVSEFGAQAVPMWLADQLARGWPRVDEASLAKKYCAQTDLLTKLVPPEAYETPEKWCLATQEYQAALIKEVVETLRLVKYRPCGGYVHFCLNDPAPVVSWSVLDHTREPKLGYGALADASAPLLPVASPIPPAARSGDRLGFAVWVVNDLREDLVDCTLEVRVSSRVGSSTRRFVGSCPADSVTRVGTIEFRVPRSRGELRIRLELKCGERHARNEYVVPMTT